MGLKSEILQIIFGALLLGLCIQFGVVSAGNDFWGNVVTGIFILVVSRFLGFLFGGR